MRYAVECDAPSDWARPWVVRDEATGREVDRFFDRKAAEIFANRMDSLREHADPAGAGWHGGKRTNGATEAWRVNGELMDRAAAVLRTANALGVCPVELARAIRAATGEMRAVLG